MRSLIPAGVVLEFAGVVAPTGFLMCDGAEINRADYPHLYSAIGDAHGEGDGALTFHLPDRRGKFARGADDMGTGAAGNDPNAGARTAANAGGNTGANVGSIQANATAKNGLGATTANTGSHIHNTNAINNVNNPSSTVSISGMRYDANGNVTTDAAGNHTHAVTITGDSETRPININMNFIIKT